ncbi:MAG: SDR family oxidoreductase [Melioribacteraceae bacterium]|nr:SDR family oxidoreductase [Melioribacteraceae bacterium]
MTNKWALVLGASSGFGGAASVGLAKAGYNILGVHLDRQATIPNAEKVKADVESAGVKAVFYNVNAADASKRKEILDEFKKNFAGDKINVLVHSLAFGTLKPFIAKNPNDCISPAQMSMTLDVMAHTIIYWTQSLVQKELLSEGGRIFGLTSAGGQTVIPSYGAVSAAKATLESHIRYLAVELGVMKVTANAIMAGVTDTAALRKIPGNEDMIEAAAMKNPHGRLTTPEEVADAIVLLCDGKASWISGNVIGVDGAEYIVNHINQKICRPIK